MGTVDMPLADENTQQYVLRDLTTVDQIVEALARERPTPSAQAS